MWKYSENSIRSNSNMELKSTIIIKGFCLPCNFLLVQYSQFLFLSSPETMYTDTQCSIFPLSIDGIIISLLLPNVQGYLHVFKVVHLFKHKW